MNKEKFDINTADDLKSITEINLLANDADNFKFRLGKDYFLYDKNNGVLFQYMDYKSLLENVDGTIIHDKKGAINNNYSDSILNGISNLKLDQFKNFNLENKEEFYINNEIRGVVLSFNGLKVKKVDENIKEVSKKMELLSKEELKPVKDIIDTFSSLTALFFLLNLKSKKKNNSVDEHNKIIGLVIDEINHGRLNLNEIERDKILMDKVPGLKEVLMDYRNKYYNSFETNLDLDSNNKIKNHSNNIHFLEQGVDNLEKLFLESGINPFLLENKKNIIGLENIIPNNDETMSFIKDFIIKDETLNYENYTTYEIAAASILAGIKSDLKSNRFNEKDNLFNEFNTICLHNSLDFRKIGELADKILIKISSFVLINENDLNTNTKLKL